MFYRWRSCPGNPWRCVAGGPTGQKPALMTVLPDYAITNSSYRLAQDGNRRVDIAVRVVVDHRGAHLDAAVAEHQVYMVHASEGVGACARSAAEGLVRGKTARPSRRATAAPARGAVAAHRPDGRAGPDGGRVLMIKGRRRVSPRLSGAFDLTDAQYGAQAAAAATTAEVGAISDAAGLQPVPGCPA